MSRLGVVLRAVPVLVAAALVSSCTGPGSAGRERGHVPGEASPGGTARNVPTDAAATDDARTTPGTPSATSGGAVSATGWGPSHADLEAARASVAAMSVEQAAGQVLVARYEGTSPEVPAALVRELHLAGVILMGDNVDTPEQVRATAGAVQDAALRDGRTWPAVVAVDQEGGTVARVGGPATEFPSLMTAGAARRPDVTRAAAAASGRELRSLGFTVVFAPVADVTSGPGDPTIGSRSASDDPRVVAEVVEASLEGLDEAGVVAVAKHYPGHGSVPADSHRELPVQDAALPALRARDLLPFRAAVDARVPAVMMSHIAVTALDPGVPASLSPAVHRDLRASTGFHGVAVTDALDMAAVAAGRAPGDVAVTALRAGADLLLMPRDVRAAHAGIVRAVRGGAVPRSRLDEAASRVVALMRWHGVRGPGTPAPDAALGGHDEQAYALSLAGLTVVSGRCRGSLVGDAVQVVGGTSRDRTRFADAARAAGLRIGSGTVVRLLGGPTTSGDGDVVVALDAPYGLASSTAGTARLALYGRTPTAFRALVDVLTGKQEARGRLPVRVRGVERAAGCPR